VIIISREGEEILTLDVIKNAKKSWFSKTFVLN
jgi:hypothetical protein